MPGVAYPSSLPGPQPGSFEPRHRRAASSIDGPLQQRARQRDAAGLASQYTYTYTHEQMAEWLAWWRDTLLDGKRWFEHDVPGRDGLVSRVVRYRSVQQQLLGVGIYRVSASLEQRGASRSPVQSQILFLGALEVAGGSSPVLVPDHQAGDLLIVFDKQTNLTDPQSRNGYTQIDGGTFGAPNRYKVQWTLLPDSNPYVLASDTGVATLGAVFRNAVVVGSVVSDVVLSGSIIGSPAVVSEVDGGSYFLQYGSCLSGAISWSGAGEELINQDPSLGGGDAILIGSGDFISGSIPGNYTSSVAGSLAACVAQLAGAA